MPKRSIKIDGVTTSLFLEPTFWDELERRAAHANTKWSPYLRSLIEAHDTTGNRSAAVKELLVKELRADLDAARANTHAAAHVSECRSRWLVERSGTRDRVEFDRPVIRVGRSGDNDIVLSDPGIDSHHLLLVFDGERWWAVDLNSTTGIKLNNKRAIVCALPRRSELALGSVEIIRV